MNSNDRPISVSELIELIEWYERLKGADDCWIRYKMFENAYEAEHFCSYGEREK